MERKGSKVAESDDEDMAGKENMGPSRPAAQARV
jgi:hypothetical protein